MIFQIKKIVKAQIIKKKITENMLKIRINKKKKNTENYYIMY